MHTVFTVRGRSGYLMIPIVVFPILAIAAPLYYKDHLPDFCIENAEKVLALVGLFELSLCLAAFFLVSRKLVLHFRGGGRTVTYQSWFGQHTFDVEAVTDLTFEYEAEGDTHYTPVIAAWTGNEEVLRLKLDYWEHAQLAQMLLLIIRANPGLRVHPRVQAFIGPAYDRAKVTIGQLF